MVGLSRHVGYGLARVRAGCDETESVLVIIECTCCEIVSTALWCPFKEASAHVLINGMFVLRFVTLIWVYRFRQQFIFVCSAQVISL